MGHAWAIGYRLQQKIASTIGYRPRAMGHRPCGTTEPKHTKASFEKDADTPKLHGNSRGQPASNSRPQPRHHSLPSWRAARPCRRAARLIQQDSYGFFVRGPTAPAAGQWKLGTFGLCRVWRSSLCCPTPLRRNCRRNLLCYTRCLASPRVTSQNLLYLGQQAIIEVGPHLRDAHVLVEDLL